MKILSYLKTKFQSFLSDLKYDRELNKVYKRANKRIKEAQGLAVDKNSTIYVLPDPNVRGDFFCIAAKEIDAYVKAGIFTKKMSGFYCIKNAIFIARPTGKNVQRSFKVQKEWLLQK